MDWDNEYEFARAGGNAGPSSAGRGRRVMPDDDDLDIPMAKAPSALSFDEPLRRETPIEQLVRHWMNERHAPDILPAQEELVVALLDHLRRQVGIAMG